MGEGARRAGEGYYVRNYLCQYLKDFKNFGEYFYARRYLHKFSKNFKIFQNMCCQCFSHFHHPSANIFRKLNVGWAFSPTKISAFTLAEVLITLGIIGVVAAMTLPSVILNYQKNVTVTQLKKAYTTISQAFMMAQSNYGDMSGWDYVGFDLDSSEVSGTLNNFANKYLIPYIKKVESCPSGTSGRTKCAYEIYNRDGSVRMSQNQGSSNDYRFIMNDGMVVQLAYNNDSGANDSGEVHFGDILFIRVDINGKKRPNMMGRDVFDIVLDPNATKVSMLGLNDRAQIAGHQTRENLLNNSMRGCNSNNASQGRTYCGALIQYDGWQIKDDYPW